MPKRPWLLGLMFLSGSLALVRPAEAQRSGFIIGFGLGLGVVSYQESTEFLELDSRSRTGVAANFHIGGVVGDSFQLYYMNKMIFFGGEAEDFNVTGVSGLGFTYPLNPDFSINAGVGIHIHFWRKIVGDQVSTISYSGLGLVAGGGYHLNQRWVLGFDMMYGKPGDNSGSTRVLGAQLTINIVSH